MRESHASIQRIALLSVGCVAATLTSAATMPFAIGETVTQVLDRLGDRATFGADCGSWSGPSIDTPVAFHNRRFEVMGLLHDDRIAALRIEQRLESIADFQACDAALDDFAAQFGPAVHLAAGADRSDFVGPVHITVRSALRRDELLRVGVAGFFEASYRASRGQCKLALVPGFDTAGRALSYSVLNMFDQEAR